MSIIKSVKNFKRAVFFVMITVLCIQFNSCGKKGPLKLIPKIFPKAITDLKINQIGDKIRMIWSFPTLLEDNETRLDQKLINKIQIYYSDKIISQDKFQRKSKLLAKLKYTDLSKNSGKLTYSFSLKHKNLNNKIHYCSINYYYKKKKSPITKIESIRTQIPVRPVKDLKVFLEGKVIKLVWSKQKINIVNKMAKKVTGYNIYKKISLKQGTADLSEFTRINNQPVVKEYFEDMSTGIDGKYSYFIRSKHTALVESANSAVVDIEITDKYAPDTPVNVVSFKAKDHIYLTWKKSADVDLSHYRIYRSLSKDDEFGLLADKIEKSRYKDLKIKKGQVYFYSVTAVDKKGNESPKSESVKEQF